MKYALNFNVFTETNTDVEHNNDYKSKSLLEKFKNIVKREFASWQEHLNNDGLKYSQTIVHYSNKESGFNEQVSIAGRQCRKYNSRIWSRHSALLSFWEEQKNV